MRLVDADAVIKEQRSIMESLYCGTVKVLKKHMDIDDDLSIPMHGMEGYAKAKQFFYGLKGILEAAQTVSAAPVVRCKGCQYWQDNNGGYPNEECRWRGDETPDADDFCSYGKRKDGDSNVHSDQRPEKRN